MHSETKSGELAALEKAVEVAGGQSAFARIHNVSQPTVWAWLNTARRLPAEYVLKTEQETGVSRYDLRPDIYPPEEKRVA